MTVIDSMRAGHTGEYVVVHQTTPVPRVYGPTPHAEALLVARRVNTRTFDRDRVFILPTSQWVAA